MTPAFEAAMARPADNAGTIAALPAPIAAVRSHALRDIPLTADLTLSSFFKLILRPADCEPEL